MRRRRMRGRFLGVLAGVAAVLSILAGCGGPSYLEGSTQEATVKGTVKVRGKLIDGGDLHFNASNPNRKVEIRDAHVGKDGTYTVKAYIGLNIVTLTPPKARTKAQDKAYFGVGYDEQHVDVKSGENTADLEFLRP
jgi:hypothetical protein